MYPWTSAYKGLRICGRFSPRQGILGFGPVPLTGRGPDSPANDSDTPGLWWLDIPGLGPETPDLGVRIL